MNGRLRNEILARDNYLCQYCGDPVGKRENPHISSAEVHNITPRSEGGRDIPDNLVTLCSDCHDGEHTTLFDDLDRAIIGLFTERDGDQPWGKATPTEVYRALDARGKLAKLGDPVRQTVQNRIQRLELAGHLENRYDSGCYAFVSDPREFEDTKGRCGRDE